MNLRKFLQDTAYSGIKFYQYLSFFIDGACYSVFGVVIRCKHTPSCSEYAKRCIKEHGTIRGTLMGMNRILHCW